MSTHTTSTPDAYGQGHYVFRVLCTHCGRVEVSDDPYTVRLFQAYHRSPGTLYTLQCEASREDPSPHGAHERFEWEITPERLLKRRERKRLDHNRRIAGLLMRMGEVD